MAPKISQILTATVNGIEAVPVTVEVFTKRGGSTCSCLIIGLGDAAVKEARERVQGAMSATGIFLPEKILINLYPAELRKEGTGFDLAIAVGLMIAAERIKPESVKNIAFFGELTLQGDVLPVRGAVALAACAAQHGAKAIVVPKANAAEAALCCDIPVLSISNVYELLDLQSVQVFTEINASERNSIRTIDDDPFADVLGQERAKRALTIAAAGGHNVLLIGPPGCGKTMLAERMARLLPSLDSHEMLETIRVYSLANQPIETILQGARPFRTPHYASTAPGFLGGGIPFIPGEISLAHHGVLFLDEFPEFKRSMLEALRLPLEQGSLMVSRAQGSLRLPANFQLVAAMNPCPCGKLGTVHRCECSVGARVNYLARLSQPILDRIDMHVELQGVSIGDLARSSRIPHTTKPTKNPIKQVHEARKLALNSRGKPNTKLTREELQSLISISEDVARLFENAAERFGLSARGMTRVLRVAKTISDLDSSCTVESRHIAEALSYRTLERQRVSA